MRTDYDYIALVDYLRSYDSEEEWFEFKVDNINPERIGEYISALSNSALLSDHPFGYLIWGIDDSTHEVVGTSFNPGIAKKGNLELLNWLALQIVPRIVIDFIELDGWNGKHVVVLEIPAASSAPVRFHGTEYIRVGSNIQELSKYPEYERELWRRFDRFPAEMRIAKSGLRVGNLNEFLVFDAYFIMQDLPMPLSIEGMVDRFIEEKFIIKADNGTYSITVLGALLFARNLLDFPSIASKAIRVISYSRDSRIEALSDVTAKEGYAISFDQICNRIYDIIRVPEVIRGGRREEPMLFPAVSIRELVGNLLIHQDLSIAGSGPLVELFPSRIEGSNPGALLVPRDRIIDAPPRVRNEALAAFLRRIRICEERGSGFDRMEEGMASMHLPSPLVESGFDFTRVKLLRYDDFSSWMNEDRIRTCYISTCLKYIESVPVSNAILRERFGIDEKNSAVVSRIVKEAIDDNRIKLLDASTGPKSRRYVPYWA